MTDLFEAAKQKHVAGQLEEAMQLYRQVIEEDPSSFRAYNNVGNVLEELGLLEEAIESYMKAAQLTDEHDIVHYNLARALHRQGQLIEAVNAYLSALNIEPGSVETRYNLGCALYDQNRYESAANAFRRAVEIDPGLTAAYSMLGNALLDLEDIEGARDAYQQALDTDPRSPAAHFNTAKIHELQGNFDLAAAGYRQSLALDSKNATAYARLAALLHRFSNLEELEEVFEQWIQALPDDPLAQHSRAAMTGQDVQERASQDYVRHLFNDFSVDYDAVLQKLAYCGPQVTHAAIIEACGPAAAELNILDAGCGTGLCGPLVKPHARQLIGVDLSPNMIAKARCRNVYDKLIEAELTEYLTEHPGEFDLVMAVDTLNYFGVLKEVFLAVHVGLRSRGSFVFTAETMDSAPAAEAGYRLRPHGRYTHTQAYLSETLDSAGFVVQGMNKAVLRTESGQPVEAYVVRTEKGPRP